MKNFFKMVLANLTAILLFFFGFFILVSILIAGIASLDSKSAPSTSNAVLTLDSSLRIAETRNEIQADILGLQSDVNYITIKELTDAIHKAKNDDNITGISIENDFISAGTAQITAIRGALADFKKSGKFIYAYGNTLSQSSYYLATIADKVYLNPAGAIELKGLSTEVIMMKDFLEKYGIQPQVIRHGKYKAAVEPFIAQEISPENREQLQTLLGDIWSVITKDIADGRKLSTQQVNTLADRLAGSIPEDALKEKLADALVYESQYFDILKKKTNSGEELNRVLMYDYADISSNLNPSGNVGIIYASGEILPGEGADGIHAENYKECIREVREDDNIKAVVLRVNSPGGSANASDEILFELKELAKKKPLVVSFGDYAASGGYWISMAGKRIFAEPTTVTGSIGVFGVIPNVQDLANRNGLNANVVQTNENANAVSLFHRMSPGALDIVTKNIENTYRNFISLVMQNRKMTYEQVDALGGGRVWSGIRAKENGLVDELGTLDDAVRYAAKLAGIENPEAAAYPRELSTFEKIFGKNTIKTAQAYLLENTLGTEGANLFKLLKSEASADRKRIIVSMPYKIQMD